MFWAGRIYRVHQADAATMQAMAEYLDAAADGAANSLEALDMAAKARESLFCVSWLVKRLIPDFNQEVTLDNRLEILRAIQLAHTDPDRARALETRDYDRWNRQNGNRANTDRADTRVP